jgi:hypothetical protein
VRVLLAILGAVVLMGAGAAAVVALRPAPLPPLHLVARPPASPAVAAGPLPELKAGSYQGTRPALIDLSADGGDIIGRITWSRWTATEAIGTGTRTLQSCKPNCAEGTDTEVPERIVLSDPEGGFFTVMVATFAGQMQEYTSGAGLWPLGAEQADQGG